MPANPAPDHPTKAAPVNDEPRTDNALIAAEKLLEHRAATGAVMTLLDLQRWFAEALQRRPSVTTLAKARKAFLAAINAPDPKTEEMRAFERAFASAIAPYRQRAEAAEQSEQDALKAADLAVASAEQSLLNAQQRFALLLADSVKKADEADLMRKAASEATDKALRELSSRLDAAHDKLNRALVREATSEAQRDGALAEAIHLKGRLQDAIVENKRIAETHVEAMKAERARSESRETRATEQMSETTKHWATQVSALRTESSELARKLVSTETALLAEKADHEKALARARRESIHAVSDEIKRLSDALGGVNALYNVHLGAVRLETQGLREAVLRLSEQIDAKVIVQEPVTLPEPTALATQERRQAD